MLNLVLLLVFAIMVNETEPREARPRPYRGAPAQVTWGAVTAAVMYCRGASTFSVFVFLAIIVWYTFRCLPIRTQTAIVGHRWIKRRSRAN